MGEAARAFRGVAVIAATYVGFLLHAQFGLLDQVRADLGGGRPVRAVLTAMGVAGVAASLLTPRWLRRRGVALVRDALVACAIVEALSLLCHGPVMLVVAGAATGASIAVLTVAVAATLPRLLPSRRRGLAVGAGTGLAYLICNLPVVFSGPPSVRALVPAALLLVAAALLRDEGGGGAWRVEPCTPSFAVVLSTFAVLVALDSAAFASVQQMHALRAVTWAGQRSLVQGAMHLGGALACGALLDAGRYRPALLGAWASFAAGFVLLAGENILGGATYAAGIGAYSAALVAYPSHAAAGDPARAARGAARLYAGAGWIGSAVGVALAESAPGIPLAATLLAGVALLVAWLPWPGLRRAFGPAVGAGSLVAIAALAPPREAAPLDAVARGRRVYVEEGCIHCHSQYVRPVPADIARFGPARPLDRRERPPLVGTRRQGPDLSNVGLRRTPAWLEVHQRAPRELAPGSRMPSYEHLFVDGTRRGPDLVAYLASLGAERPR